MHVLIKWRNISRRSRKLHNTRCLYAYLTVEGKEVFYIGKSDGVTSSVKTRMHAADKDALWDVAPDKFVLMVGDICLEDGRRYSKELLQDVESLLIKRLQPSGNIMCKKSRISRPGMSVVCFGDWPLEKKCFKDVG